MRMLPVWRCVVWLGLVVGLGACTAAQAPPPEPGAARIAEPLPGTSWELTELNGRGPVAPPAIVPTLQFAAREARASGNTGCNQYNGPYTQAGASLDFGALASTRRACTDAGANRQETAFMQVLESTTRFSHGQGMLVLYAGEQVVARFRPTGLKPG